MRWVQAAGGDVVLIFQRVDDCVHYVQNPICRFDHNPDRVARHTSKGGYPTIGEVLDHLSFLRILSSSFIPLVIDLFHQIHYLRNTVGILSDQLTQLEGTKFTDYFVQVPEMGHTLP